MANNGKFSHDSHQEVGKLDLHLGDVPSGRFGHTTTYMGNNTMILFGGAVGDTGNYSISNDTYSFNFITKNWVKIVAENAPSSRAAHAAACVDSMQFVVYGGATGGGSLSTDELYLLDLRKDSKLSWMSVPITGVTPGRRYGHTMVYHKVLEGQHRSNLVVLGGNDGTKTLSDIWFMDVHKSPFSWNKVTIPLNVKQPSPRVYHSATVCREGPAAGMIVVFGGRTMESRSLRDAWGLRQHRDGRWDWVEAPVKKGQPTESRFQHSAIFLGPKMIVIGGRDTDVTKIRPVSIYDTESCEWRSLSSIPRFRHSSCAYNDTIYTFGGFDHRSPSHPSSDILFLNVLAFPNYLNEKEKNIMSKRLGENLAGTESLALLNPGKGISSEKSAMPQSVAKSIDSYVFPSAFTGLPIGQNSLPQQTTTPSFHLSPTKRSGEVRLSAHVLTKVDSPYNPDFSALVRKISIDRLEDEGKRIRGHLFQYNRSILSPPLVQPISETDESLTDRVIRRLLRPNVTPSKLDKEFNPHASFCLSWDEVAQLCLAALNVVRNEPMVLHLRAPIKVYGDVHGQFYDLMRLFGSYKCPVEEDWRDEHIVPDDVDIVGDIDSIDYLFLGDYVDRGTHSLEVICLLFALKCRYPNQIHLIRGNHEDRSINGAYGFQDECRRRLREDPDYEDSCWEKFNKVFDYLPVGALIEDRILCIHGGIGGSIQTLKDISELKRPLTVSQVPETETEQKVTDLLWSDPTDNDSITGVIPNVTRDQDGSGRIFKYGPDRVSSFLSFNNLDLIIRAHECVMDGFERFAGGKLITLFSATDYCGHRNAGALLFIRRDLTVIPKIIYPPDRDHLHLRNTWLTMDSRPPTPPRSMRRDNDCDLGF
ncbi:uncharacterized protein LOC128884326 isoform X2 [Hylaeus volcanicus]|uniref:uncharacterized protein LOC128884326 isoform X2 n=1 Tax=Hylaeus volcanicus TaxID=313075 RepID=UPI0023B8597F|nr:uncharacterized protein LOC128884326 isoform X2 [Hylaeus volcanicus]